MPFGQEPGLICKVTKEPPHQERQGQRFIAQPEAPLIH
jgi:hypothetical protein